MRSSQDYVDLLRPAFIDRDAYRVYKFWYTEMLECGSKDPIESGQTWCSVDSKFRYAIETCSNQDKELKHWIDIDICRQLLVLFVIELEPDSGAKWRKSRYLRNLLNWDPDKIKRSKECPFMIQIRRLIDKSKSSEQEDKS